MDRRVVSEKNFFEADKIYRCKKCGTIIKGFAGFCPKCHNKQEVGNFEELVSVINQEKETKSKKKNNQKLFVMVLIAYILGILFTFGLSWLPYFGIALNIIMFVYSIVVLVKTYQTPYFEKAIGAFVISVIGVALSITLMTLVGLEIWGRMTGIYL